MTNSARKWIRSGIEILIHGGASAFIAGFMSVQQTGGWFFASTQFWQLVTAQFAGSGLLRLGQYLVTHPLPDEETTPSIPVEPVKVGMSPLSKVQPIPKPASPAPPAP